MQRGARQFGRRGRAALCVLGPALLGQLGAAPAGAQCMGPQDPAVTGDTVNCASDDPDGFVAGVGVDGLTVIVDPGVTVDNGGSGAAIGVNDDSPLTGDESRVTNEGVITATGAGAVGISAGVNANIDNGTNTPDADPMNPPVINPGAITATGSGAIGIDVGDGAIVRSVEGSTIDVSGGNNVGIRMLDSGSIVNEGAITASGSGAIGIDAGERASVEIVEGSTIAVSGGNNSGVRTLDFGSISNQGTITLNDPNSVGLEVLDSGFVNNGSTGTIELLGDDSVGITGDFVSQLRSSGTITVDGVNGTAMAGDDDSVTIQNTGTITFDADGGTALRTGTAGTVTHTGTGTITISGSNGTAISVDDDSDVTNESMIEITGSNGLGILGTDRVSITQRGNPFGDGLLLVSGDDGVAIRLESESFISTSAVSRIEALGANGVAIELGANGGDGHLLNNQGLIEGGSGTGLAIDLSGSMDGDPMDPDRKNSLLNFPTAMIRAASGVAIVGGASKDEVQNGGTIQGSISLNGGSDEVLNLGTIDGDIDLGAGDDTYVARFQGTLIGTARGGADTDTLQLGNDFDTTGGGTFDLGTVDQFETLLVMPAAGSWSVVGSGSFSDSATLASGALEVDGVVALTTPLFTQEAGTTLAVELFPDGTSDRLDVSGSAVLDPDTTLLVSADSGPLRDATSFTVLTYSSLTGQFGQIGLPGGDSAFLTLTPTYGATSLELLLERAAYVSAARTPNQFSLANNLDEILAANPTGDMASVLASIDTLSTDQFQVAADQLSPEIYDAQTTAHLALGDAFARLLEERPLRCEAMAYPPREEVRMEAPCSARGLSPWAALIGDFGSRDGGSQHASYHWSSVGGAFGLDARPGDAWLLSGELGGSYTWLGFGSQGGGNLSTLEVGAAVAYLFERAYLRGVLEYGHGWHTTRRDIGFLTRTSTGRHQSDRILLVGEAAYEFPLEVRYATLGIEPIGSAEYAYIGEGALREDGGGSVSLDVPGRSNNVFSTTLGVRLSTRVFKFRFVGDMLEWTDGIWRPEIDVRWREFWTGSDRAVPASFQGAPTGVGGFRVQAAGARRGAEIGAGVSFQPWKSRVTIGAGYQAFVGDGSFVQLAGVNVRVPLP